MSAKSELRSCVNANPPPQLYRTVPELDSSNSSPATTGAEHTITASGTGASTTSWSTQHPTHKSNSFFTWKNDPRNQELIKTEVFNQGRLPTDHSQVMSDLWYCETGGTAKMKRGSSELEEYRRMLMLRDGLRGQKLTEAVQRKYEGYDPKQKMVKRFVPRTCFLTF
jgi:hypothetical protein